MRGICVVIPWGQALSARLGGVSAEHRFRYFREGGLARVLNLVTYVRVPSAASG